MALSDKSLESMLKAVDIIATKRVDDKAYDSTIICTVVDNSDKKNGCYIVTDGAIKFKAYSEVTTYRVDEQVRVTIPNGDYTQTKYIEGKYVVDNSMSPITYVSALDGVVKIGDLTSDLTNSEGGLAANGSIEEIIIGYVDLSNKSKDLQENSIYNTLFLQADFKSLLGNRKVSAGSYGLRLDCQIRTEKEFSYITKSLYLDSSEMFGDPYSFVLFSTQSKKFSLKDFGIIDKITIYFYKNFQSNDEINAIKDLFVKNIQCGFGIDVTTIPDNTVQIYSTNSKSFAAADETNIKEINLLWYNKNKDNQYLGFFDGIIDSTYDEIDYLNQVETDKKLLAQKGKPNIPTDKNGLIISVNSEEAFSILEETQSLIKKDLKNTLAAFRDRLDGQASDQFAGILSWLDSFVNNVLYENTKKLREYLEANLAYAADLQKFQQGQLTELSKNQLECSNYYDNIDDGFALCEENIKAFLTACRSSQQISASFYGIYDTYQNRINKIMEQLELNKKNLDKLLILNTGDNEFTHLEKLVTEYEKDEAIVDYTVEQSSESDAYYCIYWYRYVEDFYDPNERFMDREWQRFTPEYEFNISSKELGTLPPNAKSLTIFLDSNKAEERFAVVLFHNHEMYKSNELVFTNDNFKNPNDIDRVNALSIKHGNNSFDNYQTFYSSSNFLRNNKDALISRELQLNYNGTEEGNEALIGASVYWYVPNHATMIDVDNSKLEKLNFSNDSAAEEIKSSYYRDGYICFYKKIESEEDTYFYYRLKNYYSPIFLKNTIFCLVEKQEDPFETDITFSFGTLGSNGTDYTLVIAPKDNHPAVIGSARKLYLLNLYDYNNNLIKIRATGNDMSNLSPGEAYFNPGKISKSFFGPSTYYIAPEISSGALRGVVLTAKSTKTPEHYCGILKMVVPFCHKEDESAKTRIMDLTVFYPIAWTPGDFYIEGVTSIVYDSYGQNPNYYKNPYKIFNSNTGEELQIGSKLPSSQEEVSSIQWRVVYFKEDGEKANNISSLDKSYLPVINDRNILIPCNMYVDNINLYPVVQCFINDTLYWSQPIVIMQNRYPSPMLNAWDGSLTIDENEGTILSTMIGAGRKTTNNTFEGILMGDITGGAGIKTGIGLYGFNDGAQSFGLNIDGTAFFGKSGGGRIEFDGNSGIIKSAGWNDDCTSGMKIDLDDGIIDIRGVTDNGFDQIRLNASEEEPYFLIKSDDSEILHIGKNNYFLQSKNYNETSGMRIDLNSGILECVGAIVSGAITATSLTLSDCTIPAGDIDGLSSVATSGNYNDLSNKPTIKDLGFNPSEVVYKSEITQTIKEDANKIKYVETIVPTENGNITYSTYDADDYIVFGRSKGTDNDGENYVCISKNGLLTARNALIYGTIHATAGEFNGKITADEGKIGNWYIGTNGLYDADPEGTTSVFLVPGGKSVSDSNKDKFVISVGQYSNFNSETNDDDKSYFGVTTTGKLYAKGGTFKGHLSAWSGTIGGCTISGGKIKGTGWEVSGAGIAINGVNMTTLKTVSIPVYTPYTYIAQGVQKRPYISSLQTQKLSYLTWDSSGTPPTGFKVATKEFVTGGTPQVFQSNTYTIEYIGKAPVKE